MNLYSFFKINRQRYNIKTEGVENTAGATGKSGPRGDGCPG
jgi:hypothetical protein